MVLICGMCDSRPAEFMWMCRIADGEQIHGDVCEECRAETASYADEVVPL